MPPLHIHRIGPFLPVLAIILIPVFFPRVGPQKRLARVVPGLLPGYSRVIPILSRVRPCYLSGHGSQATQNVPYSSILSALARINPCCSRVVPMLLPCCSRVAPVFPVLFPSCPVLSRVAPCCPVYKKFFSIVLLALVDRLQIPVLIQVIPVLFPGYYAFFQYRD